MSRILKLGGAALFLHDPACPPLWYLTAKIRMDRRNHGVPEDLLLTGKLKRFAAEFGMTTEVIFAPTLINRGPVASFYYFMLRTFPFIQKFMPYSVDLLFRKQRIEG